MKLTSKLYVMFIAICFGLMTLSAQTVYQVAEGTDVLKTAIDAAAAGDVIELTTSGGLYLSADQIELDKDITIRAHADLAVKPVLKYVGTATSAYMFKGLGSARIALEGLEFDGDGTGDGAAALAKYVVRLDNGDTTATLSLHMDNCVAHDFNDKFIKPYGSCGMDSLVVTNSIFYNGASEGIVLYSGSSGDPAVDLDVAIIENCTFYNIEREAIKGQTNPDTKVLVDHCTFYNIGEADKKAMIYFRDMTDVVVKNSVFSENNNPDAEKFADFESDASLFHHNTVWATTNYEVGSATVSDTLHADPLFLDAVNADFTLAATSPAIGYADDGKAAGDLRWDPTAGDPVVYSVDEGTDVLKAAIDAAAPGDIIELTTSGGLYLSSDQIVLDKNLTIRANEFLAEKPVLKYIGPETGAYMFRVEETPKLYLSGLDFAGDGTAEGGAAKAKYIFRIDNGGDSTSTIVLKIDDCILHDTQDKLIKPYPSVGIDSLLVHNSILYNSDKEGVTLNSGSSSDPEVKLRYAEFYNSTFYSTTREAIKGDVNLGTKVLVNQCTFYNIGGTDKPFIYMDDITDVEIKNSIFVKNLEDGNFVRLESDENSFHHNVIWDVNDWDVDNTTNVSDTLHADPLFMNPANADFTLGENSPARTAAEGGTPAGDLRWAIDPNAVVVSLVTLGNGVVILDPPGGVYEAGTSVTFTAQPDLGWEFDSWTGLNVFPPDANPATVTVNENIEVTATFVSLTPQVTLTVETTGLGTVEADPVPSEAGTYDEGAVVELTAVPEAGWEFVEWLGDYTGTDNPTSITLDSNKTVTASFRSTAPQVNLTINVVGMGDVTASPLPILGTYDVNTVVTLTAEAAMGWSYVGMTGDLVSSATVDSLTLDVDKVVTVTFEEIAVPGGVLSVDDSWDLMDIVDFANNNSQAHTVELTTSGGIYTTTKSGTVYVTAPVTIRAAADLEAKPIITNTDPEGTEGTIDILRVFDDITLEGVVINGSTDYSAGMKYGVRYSNSSPPDTVRWGANAIFRNVDFMHLYDDGKETGDGHAFKIDREMILGVVKFEDCTFYDIGYEALRISDTEKWLTDRCLDSLIVRNCTFTNIDAEGIRYYSDTDPSTSDAPVLLEHLTFNNTATSVAYLKNSGGAIARDIIIANSRESGHGRDGFLIDVQGSGDFLSYTSHINVWNVPDVPIESTDAELDSATVYNLDPQFADAENMDYTLLATSPMYGLGHDGLALGDLNWATQDPVSVDDKDNQLPKVFSLDQNYPNPFNPSTNLRFGLPQASNVTMKIYNILGQEVAVLFSGQDLAAGFHNVVWNGTNTFGQTLATGMYIYRIKAVGQNGNEFVQSKKMLFLK